MSISNVTSTPLTANTAAPETQTERRGELEARRVAEEFEGIFMAQLTAPLGPSEEASEEDDMFRSDATDMYQRLFSEQMAGAMAKSGGIGLADVVMSQLRPKTNSSTQFSPSVTKALDAVRSINRPNASASANSIELSPASGLAPESISPTNESFGATRPRRVVPLQEIQLSEEPLRLSEPTALQMPLEGRISSRFGSRRDPVNGHQRFHHGVDIAASKGSAIGAMSEGTVVFAGTQGGYGKTVVIEHADGRQSRYAHAERLLVTKGEAVHAGQTIATVGSTGRSTGAHLHLEVSEHGRRVDPLRALSNDLLLARR